MRFRALILCGPGAALLVAALGAYVYSRQVSNIGFDKWKLATYGGAGLVLTVAAMLLHRKAAADDRALRRAYWKTVAFLLFAIVVLPALTVFALDKAAGLVLAMSPARPGLVFPPHYRVSYKTPEFTFTAETNGIGIRDREVDPQVKDRFRVLAIGDSYTYGWGVDLSNAWPKLLEPLLAEKERPAEVLDLGCPGTSVDAYAVIAERAVPVLRPDAIVVAVLQGDDLKQLDLEPTTSKLAKFNGVADGPSSFGGLIATFVPHVVELAARQPRTVTAQQIQAVWQGNTRDMRKKFDEEESRRFNALDDTIKGMMIGGEMNPWDVYYAVKQPDYFEFTLHPDRPEVRRAIDSMAANLAKIKEAAVASNAQVITVPVPAACYACAKGLESRRRVGYRLDDSVLRSDAPDDAIRQACKQAGVRFLSVTERFRAEAKQRDLYFEYDGHFNPEGHAVFAKLVAEHFNDPGE
jgi:hypothetical protein